MLPPLKSVVMVTVVSCRSEIVLKLLPGRVPPALVQVGSRLYGRDIVLFVSWCFCDDKCIYFGRCVAALCRSGGQLLIHCLEFESSHDGATNTVQYALRTLRWVIEYRPSSAVDENTSALLGSDERSVDAPPM